MVRQMKKRFIAKRNKSSLILKIIICIVIVFLTFLLTVKILFKAQIKISDEKRVNELLAIASNNVIGDISIFDLLNMNLASPETFLKLSFSGFKKLEYPEQKISSSVKVNNVVKDPIIYIYNTHQNEEYDAGTLKEYNIIPTVYMASVMLQKSLEKKEIYSIVEESNIKNLLNEKGITYNDSYYVTRELLQKMHDNSPTIKYFIDIHRDSVSDRITVDDITYAKLMFVVGMNHSNYTENDKLMTKLKDNINNEVPGVVKNNFYGKNSRYNQDFNNNTILIEVGGPKNTIDEVYNSINLLANAIEKVIGDESG